jgi:hypothetical protein
MNCVPLLGVIIPGSGAPASFVRKMGGSEYGLVRSSYVNQYPPGSAVPVVWRPDMSSMRRASFGQEMAAPPLLPPPPPEPPPEEELPGLELQPVATYVVAPSEAASPTAVTDTPKTKTFLFIWHSNPFSRKSQRPSDNQIVSEVMQKS